MKTHSNILIHSAIFSFFLLLFLLVYAPITQGHYFYGEDYVFLWSSEWPGITTQSYDSYAHVLHNEGRPLWTVYIFTIFQKYINALKSYEAANTIQATIVGSRSRHTISENFQQRLSNQRYRRCTNGRQWGTNEQNKKNYRVGAAMRAHGFEPKSIASCLGAPSRILCVV